MFAQIVKKYQNDRGPPEYSAIGNIHRDILLLVLLHYTTCHLKQLPVGLMVLSEGMVPLSEDQ